MQDIFAGRDKGNGLCVPILIEGPGRVPQLAPLDRRVIRPAFVVSGAPEGVVRNDALDKIVEGSHTHMKRSSCKFLLTKNFN